MLWLKRKLGQYVIDPVIMRSLRYIARYKQAELQHILAPYLPQTPNIKQVRPDTHLTYVPDQSFFSTLDGPYMATANCQGIDFYHRKFVDFCRQLKYPPAVDRKLWEFAFIHQHLLEAGMLTKGRRGLVFGVGLERLPALFAAQGIDILATDAPPDIADPGWTETAQHSGALEQLFFPDLVDEATFRAHVTYEPADMNNIGAHLHGFDFCWSSCCFEHLGSLRHGLDFVKNTMKTLKPGGISVHTTELNLSSNTDTLETGMTVLYRPRDLEQLIAELRADGHIVKELPIRPGLSYIDGFIDVPPHTTNAFIKLTIGQYISTSVGIVIQKGG